MDIHKAGGGIMFTVGHTRSSSEEELFALLNERLDTMLKLGSTLIEAKSGLDTLISIKKIWIKC
jgi:imidazolonepropionase